MANKIEKNKSKSSNDIEIPLIYNKSTEEIKRFKFIFIFFSSLTDFTQSLLAIIVYDESIYKPLEFTIDLSAITPFGNGEAKKIIFPMENYQLSLF